MVGLVVLFYISRDKSRREFLRLVALVSSRLPPTMTTYSPVRCAIVAGIHTNNGSTIGTSTSTYAWTTKLASRKLCSPYQLPSLFHSNIADPPNKYGVAEFLVKNGTVALSLVFIGSKPIIITLVRYPSILEFSHQSYCTIETRSQGDKRCTKHDICIVFLALSCILDVPSGVGR